MDSAKIFIDTDNEITFVLEKILSAKSDRVCLVVPDRASLFTSVSGLKLIKRVVDKSNKLVVLVTLDENGSTLAKNSGLIVVSRVGEITDSVWETAQKNKFEFMKKSKNRVYYQPDKKSEELAEKIEIANENTKISIQELIKEDDVKEAVEVVEAEIQNENLEHVAEEEIQTVEHEPETIDIGEIPQVRIRIDADEVEEAKEHGEEDSKKEEKINLENLEKNDKTSASRMRRTAENSNSLSFTFGEDINPQKKK